MPSSPIGSIASNVVAPASPVMMRRIRCKYAWFCLFIRVLLMLHPFSVCFKGKNSVHHSHMAGTIHPLRSFRSATSTEEDLQNYQKSRQISSNLLCKKFWKDPSFRSDNSSSKVGPWYADLMYKESLWINGLYNPSEDLTSRRFVVSCGELCERSGSASASFPVVNLDEGAAFVAILRACTKNRNLYRGTRIHDDILKRGLLKRCSDALVIMYAKCGDLGKAKALLDMHKSRDVIAWTSLIAGYARDGQGQNALDCFKCMQHEGILPDAVTYTCILKACATLGALEKGEQIHDEIVRQGLMQNNIVLGTALLDMYAKCGAILKAKCVLEQLPSRGVVSWNALIAGYAQEGQGEQALNCFEQMQGEGILPNAVTYTCILKACASIGAADKGKKFHDEIARQGLLQNDIVLGTALVDMYAKCGALSKAQCVLEELPSRGVVSWNALIAGYARSQGEQALDCFEQMQHEGIRPNAVTYACILKACALIGAGDKGEQIHDEIARLGLLQNDIVLGTALVDMYAKCGAPSKAHRVLEELPSRDVISWSAVIAGYAQEGQGEQALNCFECMQGEGILPNAATFLCVLNVYSHLGLVEEGYALFVSMSTKYGVKPDLECYTCMVDLLGRAGHLEKAVQLVQEMPFFDHPAMWHALLGACLKCNDVNVGRWAFEQAIQVDKTDDPAYVLMANIYAAAGMHENAKKIKAMGIRTRAKA